MKFAIPKKPFASEAITVSNTVKSLTAATYLGAASTNLKYPATGAVITVSTESITYKLDGTDPTAATNGHLQTPTTGFPIILESLEEIQKFRAIRSAGADAIIHVTYFRSM